MKITAIEIENIRCFQKVPKTEFSKGINVFIGQNNSGKTTLLKCIHFLQIESLSNNDITKGAKLGQIALYYDDEHLPEIQKRIDNIEIEKYIFELSEDETNRYYRTADAYVRNNKVLQKVPNAEPNNLIYPYLSKRKVEIYNEISSQENANLVPGNLAHLYLKIDRLITGHNSAVKEYKHACNTVLGFEIDTSLKGNGKEAVYHVDGDTRIPITSMGEGVANVLGLIADLCYAKKDRIFLIEEIENDIHPKALKALLSLIINKSSYNQFFISTHSNIVMKYLGSEPGAKIFNVISEIEETNNKTLFVSRLSEVTDEPGERRRVLEDLGYEFFDFDLWSNWLFLEESSAEILIRDYFVKWFTPQLFGKLRTFSANGKSNLNPKFDDFNRLFVFLHLQPTYKNKAWVLIDGGDEEAKIIQNMRETYSKSGWSESNFSQLEKHDFELYYPNLFQDKVALILALNGDDKRKAKKDLINEVKDWIKDNEELAKSEFEKSAAEVIEKLKSIEKQIAL